MKHLIITLFIVAFCGSSASAITYQVGPSRTYKKMQDVAALLAPGDLVEVDGNATYPGDLIFTRPGTVVNKITIRGLRVNGLRPIISGGLGTNPGFTNISTYDVRPIATSPLFPPAYHPPLHTALAVGTASARPVFGAIDIGAYEYTP